MPHKGYKHSEIARKNMSIARTGSKLSDETKRKLSELHKGMFHSLETRRKLSEISKGRKPSEASKNKMSISHMRDPVKRFWKNVDTSAGPDSCWPWTGYKDYLGYGHFCVSGVRTRVHRFSYQLHYGEIPNNCQVQHLCNKPLCVNPKHLVVGTQKDNMAYMAECGRAQKRKGEAHSRAKLTEREVLEIRSKYIPWKYPQSKLAEEYGMSAGAIYLIISGTNWSHI